MSADDLCPTVVGWFRDDPERVLDVIADASGITRANMRRPNVVADAVLRRDVPQAAQRLIRWSIETPANVFIYGFPPLEIPRLNVYSPETFNLRMYVLHDTPSIFVSTTVPYRDEEGHLDRWQRRQSQARWRQWEYDIFAYGGIDVNRALGHHENERQREIAFVGGIRPEMIRSAREYEGTQIVRVWLNANFDNRLNPPGQNPALSELPDVRRIPPQVTMRIISAHFIPPPTTSPPPDHPELRPRRSASMKNTRVLMPSGPRDDGKAVRDIQFDITPVPLSSVACMMNLKNSTQAYIFCGNRYVLIQVNPGTTDDTIVLGPEPIVSKWSSISKAGFGGGVDAVLRNPKNAGQFYFFSLGDFALIDMAMGTTNDYIVDGPKKIFDGWPSLQKAGFATIDAILPNPYNNDEAYFFCGYQYALIKIKAGTTDDYIIHGPASIASEWRAFDDAGVIPVDMILPNPSNYKEAYFFSGKKYALINIDSIGKANIVNGPREISTEWPSLKKCAFW